MPTVCPQLSSWWHLQGVSGPWGLAIIELFQAIPLRWLRKINGGGGCIKGETGEAFCSRMLIEGDGYIKLGLLTPSWRLCHSNIDKT